MNRKSADHTDRATRVLAAASLGGHWIQLLRLTAVMHRRGCEVHYLSTHDKCATMIPAGSRFYRLGDFSRTDAWRLIPALWRAIGIVRRERPDIVVSTGAAPGLVAILAARLCGRRAVWVDSIANVERLSMCGRLASRIASETFTQWPELTGPRVRYAGNVLGDNA